MFFTLIYIQEKVWMILTWNLSELIWLVYLILTNLTLLFAHYYGAICILPFVIQLLNLQDLNIGFLKTLVRIDLRGIFTFKRSYCCIPFLLIVEFASETFVNFLMLFFSMVIAICLFFMIWISVSIILGSYISLLIYFWTPLFAIFLLWLMIWTHLEMLYSSEKLRMLIERCFHYLASDPIYLCSNDDLI